MNSPVQVLTCSLGSLGLCWDAAGSRGSNLMRTTFSASSLLGAKLGLLQSEVRTFRILAACGTQLVTSILLDGIFVCNLRPWQLVFGQRCAGIDYLRPKYLCWLHVLAEPQAQQLSGAARPQLTSPLYKVLKFWSVKCMRAGCRMGFRSRILFFRCRSQE